jgi:tRNA(fMet)-specific endonuclease VapC
MTAHYLLDTNHFSGLWREQAPVVDRLAAQPAAHFAVSLPSAGELWFMVFHSARVAANRRRLATLLGDFELLDFDRSAAVEFGRIKAELHRRGTIIPDVDLQIAAIARSQGLVLLTADAHFSHVGGLITEDWSKRQSRG